MVDVVSSEKRSQMMSGIRGKDTKPELIIRKALHALGYRYRLHDKRLPGKPDLVLSKHNAIIYIHGCFWHGHNCHLFKWPSSRPEFWRTKIFKNRENDEKAFHLTKEAGWRVLTIWECALKGREKLDFTDVIDEITSWLHSGEETKEIRGAIQSANQRNVCRNKGSGQAETDDGCGGSSSSFRQKACAQ